jgi:hypothetical protein
VIYIYNILRTLCTMGPLCHVWLFLPSSLLLHEAVVASSAGDPLVILLPAWRAGPSPIPPTRVDPISLGFQAPSYLSVRYSTYTLLVRKGMTTSTKCMFNSRYFFSGLRHGSPFLKWRAFFLYTFFTDSKKFASAKNVQYNCYECTSMQCVHVI